MFCFKLQEVKTSDLFVGDERNISLTPITKKEGVHTFRLPSDSKGRCGHSSFIGGEKDFWGIKIIGCPDLCLCIRGCTLLPLSSVICTCTAVFGEGGLD